MHNLFAKPAFCEEMQISVLHENLRIFKCTAPNV